MADAVNGLGFKTNRVFTEGKERHAGGFVGLCCLLSLEAWISSQQHAIVYLWGRFYKIAVIAASPYRDSSCRSNLVSHPITVQ